MSMASEALGAIGLWLSRRERKQDRDDIAVVSVLSAIDKTKIYLASRDRGEPADRAIEAELVTLWTAAAVHIRRTDPDLAVRLRNKADYWTNPENWTDLEIIQNRIQIEAIEAEGRRLLESV